MNQSHQPLVSLIVPCYNIANVCDRFFQSLLFQTYTHIQLILVNDGSTDNSEEKLMSFKASLEEKGYQVDYFYQANKGLGGAINTGLKKIQGEFFCWADPDDFYEDNAFEIRVEYFFNHPECNVLTGDANIRNVNSIAIVNSRIAARLVHHNEKKQFEYMMDYQSMFCPGTHMIRTEAFKKINPSMDIYEARHGQNQQLLLPMYYFYDRYTIATVVYNYVIYKNSMSHNNIDYKVSNDRIEEKKKIQIETINRIEMPKAERCEYIRHIEVFHDKLKMYNARAYLEKADYKEIYTKLRKQHALDWKDKVKRLRFIILGK